MKKCWKPKPGDRISAEATFHLLASNKAYIHQQSFPNFQEKDTKYRIIAKLHRQTLKISETIQNRFGKIPYVQLTCGDQLLSKTRIAASQAFNSFLESTKSVLLLLGDSGSGKSLLLSKMTEHLWKEFDIRNIVVVFAQLPQVKHPVHGLINNVLKSQGLTTSEIEWLQKDPVRKLLIFDGYDETSCQSDLFVTNRMFEWKNLQVVISCRTERVFGIYGMDGTEFYPCDASLNKNRQGFQMYVLQPFNVQQISEYLKQYLDLGIVSEEEQNILSEQLKNEELQQMTENPFVLYLVVQVILGPYRCSREHAPRIRFLSMNQLYERFLINWFSQQEARLRQQGLLPNADGSFSAAVWRYCVQLAISLFSEHTQVAPYSPTDTLVVESEDQQKQVKLWGKHFDDRYHQWSFLHKSIFEYLIALTIIYELRTTSMKKATRNLLNVRTLNTDLGIVAFVCEKVRRNHVLQERLFSIVYQTRSNKTLSTAAANSITILNRSYVSFSGRDLSDISIPNALLDGAILDSTNLKNSDISGLNLKGAFLDRANLTSSNLKDVTFESSPFFKTKGDVIGAKFDQAGRLYVSTTNSNKSKIRMLDIRSGRTLWKLKVDENIDLYWNDSFCVSSDGRYIFAPINKNFTGHKAKVRALSLSSNKELLASGGMDKTVMIWSVKTGDCVYKFTKQPLMVTAVAFSPDCTMCFSACNRKMLLWNLPNLEIQVEKPSSGCYPR